MKKLILLVAISLLCVHGKAQVDTTKLIQTISANGYAYKHLQALYAMLLPTDTLRLKSDWRGIAFKGTAPYYWNGSTWQAFSSGGGSADSTVFATIYRLDTAKTNLRTLIGAKLAIADTSSMLSVYVRAQRLADTAAAIRAAIGSGGVTSVATGYGLSGGTITSTGTLLLDSATVSAYYLRRKDSVTASNPLGFVSWKLLRDTASAIRSAIGGGSLTGSGVDLRVALWNGTSSLTSHQRYTYTNSNDYPSFIIGAGTGATYGASIQFRDVAGTYSSITTDGGPTSYYGSSTYKSHNFYDYAGGAGLLARFYSGTGTRYAEFPSLGVFSSLSVPSNEQGAVTISRTVPYAPTGNNYHGFTDQTIWRLGNEAFNSFGSFVKMGNNRTDFNHYAAFQAVWQKDSTNKVGTIYDFVSAVSTMTGGTVDTLSRFEAFDATKTGGTIGKQYGIKIRNLTSASTNIGAWIYNNVGIGPTAHTPTERLVVDGNISGNGTVATGDPGGGSGAWKLGAYHSGTGLYIDPTGYIEVSIGGVTYWLALAAPPIPKP